MSTRRTAGAIFAGHLMLLGGEGDQSAKILQVETQDDPRRAVHQAMLSIISPQTSVKVVGGYGTSVWQSSIRDLWPAFQAASKRSQMASSSAKDDRESDAS